MGLSDKLDNDVSDRQGDLSYLHNSRKSIPKAGLPS